MVGLNSSSAPYFIAMGASGSDGLADIRNLLAALPAHVNGVLMAVLHRPSDELSRLREVLSRASAIPVVIPKQDDVYQPGICYIGEPAAHLALAERSRVHLIDGGLDRYRNRTVDLLFSSIAAHAGKRAIGVVLSGSLDDGSRGLADIHHRGGQTIVLRSEGMSNGMPDNARTYDGPVDFIGSVEEIARHIEGSIA